MFGDQYNSMKYVKTSKTITIYIEYSTPILKERADKEQVAGKSRESMGSCTHYCSVQPPSCIKPE